MNHKLLGQLMVAGAFLVAAFMTSLDKNLVDWHVYIPAMMFGIIGIIIIRKAEHKEAHSEGVLTTNLTNIEESLSRIVNNLVALNDKKNVIPPYEMRFEIERVEKVDTLLAPLVARDHELAGALPRGQGRLLAPLDPALELVSGRGNQD